MNSQLLDTIIKPINQLNLYGYNKIFNDFKLLYKNNKLPNTILLSGAKGSGKSTFLFHFINFLLSENEDLKYLYDNYKINAGNSSFNLVQNGTHSNFFLLDSINSDDIKIDQVRKLIKFVSKTTFYKGIKIVLIDNAENLNINSSNALLKSIEEPNPETFFFIVNNDSYNIPYTLKSRCVNFKVHFTAEEKKSIFKKIVSDYNINYTENDLDRFFLFDSPGNFLKYLFLLGDNNKNICSNVLHYISFLVDQNNKSTFDLRVLSLLIENYYNELAIKDAEFISYYHKCRTKILNLIHYTKKFNLDKKNLIFSINQIITNEK